MKSVPYITPSHLQGHLLKMGFFPHTSSKRHSPMNVGICVSGGPDSMALAYLLQKMSHPHVSGMKAFSPRAFIVDHCARDDSYEEALWVKNQLKALDIETDIQRIEWSHSVDPRSMPGFEWRARQRRYNALVELARTHRVMHLFTGHHEDDQVETVFLRLFRDHTLNPFSFRVMNTPAPVPCDENLAWASSRSYLIHQASTTLPGLHTATDQLQYEKFSTGAQLYRPLIKYQKSHLVATCDHFEVPYVHDETNFNPQFTVRNAIRHLRTSHSLPRALQTEGILNLRNQSGSIIDAIEERARKFCDYILRFRMHSQSGVIFLRLKPLPHNMDESQLRGLSYFIQRLVALVAPSSFQNRHAMLEKDYTERLLRLISGSEKEGTVVVQKVVCRCVADISCSGGSLLSFSRQPFTISEQNQLTKQCAPRDPHVSNMVDTRSSGRAYKLLWDHRFWIRITGEKDVLYKTIVRPYARSDIPAIAKALEDRNLLKTFSNTLSSIAPGSIRHTLPVIVVSDVIVAFPTLDFAITSNPPINWSVKYARDRQSTDFFLPGVKHNDEILWNFEESTSSIGHEVSVPDGNSRKMYPLYNRIRKP